MKIRYRYLRLILVVSLILAGLMMGCDPFTQITPIGTSNPANITQNNQPSNFSVQGISPTTGSFLGGNTLNVTGTGFTSLPLGFAISINGQPCAAPTVVNSTLATCTMPASSQTASSFYTFPVHVVNGDGNQGSVNSFSYLASAPQVNTPYLSSLGTTLCNTATDSNQCRTFSTTMIGSNFLQSSSVSLAGTSTYGCNTTYVSSTQLNASCAVGAGSTVSTGSYTMVVTNPGGIRSNSQTFTISTSTQSTGAPTLSSLSNTSCSTTTDSSACSTITTTVTGSNFVSGATANFYSSSSGGSAYTCSLGYSSSTQVSVTCSLTSASASAVPATYLLSVSNPGAQTSNTLNFTISTPSQSGPSITSLSNSFCNTTTDSTDCVTISTTLTGTGFQAGDTAAFSGNVNYACTLNYSSSTQVSVSCTVVHAAGGTTTGTYNLTVSDTSGHTSNQEQFTLSNTNPPPPPSTATITSLSVTTCNIPTDSVGCDSITTVATGTNFVSGASATMSGPEQFNCTTSYTSSTQMSVTCNVYRIASGVTVGNYSISITDPSSTASNTQSFTITNNTPPVATPVLTALSQNTCVTTVDSSQCTTINTIVTGTGITPLQLGVTLTNGTTSYLCAPNSNATSTSVPVTCTIGTAVAGTYTLNLTNYGGSASNGLTITVQSSSGTNPAISSLSPSSCALVLTTPVNYCTSFSFAITGTNFGTGDTVTMTGGPDTFTCTAPTSISSTSISVSCTGNNLIHPCAQIPGTYSVNVVGPSPNFTTSNASSVVITCN